MILENANDIQLYKQQLKNNLMAKSETTIVPNQEKIDMTAKEQGGIEVATINNQGIIKRFIPYYIYKPPFGFPRRDIDIINCRRLAKTPFVFSVIKTLLDEITSAKWDIVPNEEIQEESVKPKVKSIKEFFQNPNGNNESFRAVLRAVCRDVFELDAGAMEKVYNRKGEISQLYSVDGSTILLNPDEHGYLGNRLDYVPVYDFATLDNQQAVQRYYTNYLKETAAYFQYNWTGGVWPVPFGKKEIVYIKANDGSDSIYGTSPVQVLYNVILTLVYAAQVNLDMYANNNLPTGILSIMEANKDQLKATREYFNTLTSERDIYGNNRKKYFNVPITSTEAKYTDFSISAKDMQMIEQQKWYQQIVWQCFGITPEEMGVVENSNRSTSNEASRIFKRKALNPIFKLLEYHINTQIVWELDPQREICFKFDDYDVESQFRISELNEKLLNTTWTLNEIRIKDNMMPLKGEEYDKPKGMTPPIQNGFGMDALNTEGNKDDASNEERSPEKEGKKIQEEDEEETESVTKKSLEDDVPVKTELEKKLILNYKDMEKQVLEMMN